MKVGDLVWVSWYAGRKMPEMVILMEEHVGWGGWSVTFPGADRSIWSALNDQIVRPVTQEELAKHQLTQLDGL